MKEPKIFMKFFYVSFQKIKSMYIWIRQFYFGRKQKYLWKHFYTVKKPLKYRAIAWGFPHGKKFAIKLFAIIEKNDSTQEPQFGGFKKNFPQTLKEHGHFTLMQYTKVHFGKVWFLKTTTMYFIIFWPINYNISKIVFIFIFRNT